MKVVHVLALKDLRLLARHRGEVFFVLAWPVMLAVLFGVIFAAPPEGRSPLGIALVDEDGSDGSRAYAERLGRTAGLDVVSVSRTEAEAMVRQGKRIAWVALTSGFGEASANPFGAQAPPVEIGIDPTRKAEAAMLEGLLAREAAEGLQERLSDREASRRMVADALSRLRYAPPWSPEKRRNERFLAELDRWLAEAPDDGGGVRLRPLAVETKAATADRRGPRSSFEFTFPQGMLWGLLACAANFAVGLVKERSSGTMGRLLSAPLTRRQILLGKALACFVAMLGMEILLVAVGVVAFGVRPTSWPLLAAAVLAAALAFTGIMMVLSVLGGTEQSASGAAWATLLVVALLGGGMVPLFVMPRWMLTASGVSPAKWAILAFEGALWRGFSPAEMALPLGLLVAIGAMGLILGTRLFRTH
jgi:ABC-2 type transport system permease protein